MKHKADRLLAATMAGNVVVINDELAEDFAVLGEILDHSSNDDIIDAVHEALAMLDELF